jgi:ParB/RepB/Spo0J family partition protein
MADVRVVPIGSIRRNTVALRGVDKENPKFLELVASIAAKGVINPIAVREKVDGATNETYLEVIDGLHRFTASCEAGLQEIPVNVMTVSEAENLDIQISANLHKIETKPVEYARALLQILSGNATMTLPELAGRLNVSTTFIDQRLALIKLAEEIKPLVNEGKIAVASAYALSKLPRTEQPEWVTRAMTENANAFVPACQARIKEISEANKKGKDPAVREFQPYPVLRKRSLLDAEYANPDQTLKLVEGKTDPAEIVVNVLAWVLSLDEPTVAEAKSKWEAAEAEKKAKAEARAAEKEAKKKADEAAKATEAVNTELDLRKL